MNYQPIYLNYNEDQLTRCRERLRALLRDCGGAKGALITTMAADVVAHTLDDDLASRKLSTMTSSLLDLGELIAQESLQKQCQFTIVENSDGRVVSLRINDDLMLTSIFSRESNLGMALSHSRKAADDLAKLLV